MIAFQVGLLAFYLRLPNYFRTVFTALDETRIADLEDSAG
jgi:hypothetical protein